MAKLIEFYFELLVHKIEYSFPPKQSLHFSIMSRPGRPIFTMGVPPPGESNPVAPSTASAQRPPFSFKESTEYPLFMVRALPGYANAEEEKLDEYLQKVLSFTKNEVMSIYEAAKSSFENSVRALTALQCIVLAILKIKYGTITPMAKELATMVNPVTGQKPSAKTTERGCLLGIRALGLTFRKLNLAAACAPSLAAIAPSASNALVYAVCGQIEVAYQGREDKETGHSDALGCKAKAFLVLQSLTGNLIGLVPTAAKPTLSEAVANNKSSIDRLIQDKIPEININSRQKLLVLKDQAIALGDSNLVKVSDTAFTRLQMVDPRDILMQYKGFFLQCRITGCFCYSQRQQSNLVMDAIAYLASINFDRSTLPDPQDYSALMTSLRATTYQMKLDKKEAQRLRRARQKEADIRDQVEVAERLYDRINELDEENASLVESFQHVQEGIQTVLGYVSQSTPTIEGLLDVIKRAFQD